MLKRGWVWFGDFGVWKKSSQRGERGRGVVVRNMKAIFFGVVGFGFVRDARRKRASSSSSSSSSSTTSSSSYFAPLGGGVLGFEDGYFVVVVVVVVVVVLVVVLEMGEHNEGR
eukprot:TRINITY_DN47018_c2_g1_i1.p2 TRINITY_DN47018_c2_g1~~TRINITY_DN47018_c2_g1_i1.p2  ORF type:complete len:113 (-),score=49.06 TRINITY_DN47018_c2_g1_i1:293-631(-)